MSFVSSINQKLAALAGSDLAEFRQFFRRLRKAYPEQAIEALLWHVATHGLDAGAQSLAFWLAGDQLYIAVLLDPEVLPPDVAAKAVVVVKEMDPQFMLKFAKAAAELKSPATIMRALGLLPAIGNYSILIPWLRALGQHSDDRVRARSSKLMCELRPNKSLIERQMLSDDTRVRASAIEALWHCKSEDPRPIFRSALGDPNHRVVGNALVGLYLLGEGDALNRMIELCAHQDPLFRAAMAWAMAFVKDARAIPVLQELTRDSSQIVRKRALDSLKILEPLSAVEVQSPVAPGGDVEKPGAVATEAPEPAPQEPEFNLFLFR